MFIGQLTLSNVYPESPPLAPLKLSKAPTFHSNLKNIHTSIISRTLSLIMAPGRIEVVSQGNSSEDLAQSSFEIPNTNKATIYLLENFPPAAIKHCQTLFNTILPNFPEIANWRENATAILVREQEITASDIESSQKLRAIGKQGTGIDIIDQEACLKRGIPILNTPGVNAQSVAELVLTLTMAVARQLPAIISRQVLGEEVRKEHCCGTTMTNKSIGLLGMGAVGRAVALMFRGAFNCTIYAYDPFLPADAWSDIPHIRVREFEDMLPSVDMLSLHIPLNAKTRGLISWKQLSQMKPTAILINAARGGIVNEADLTKALEMGVIWGAGLDCHDVEPPTLESARALWKTGKVLSAPHIGATTKETQVETAVAAINRIHEYLQKSS